MGLQMHGPNATCVHRVTIAKRTIIPPWTRKIVPCRPSCPCDTNVGHVVETIPLNKPVMASRSLVRSIPEIPMDFCNLSEGFVTMKKSQWVGNAMDGIQVSESTTDQINQNRVDTNDDDVSMPMVGQVINNDTTDDLAKVRAELPAHLMVLWETSCQHLEREQQIQVGRLLIEYSDVFAKHDFDLGQFSGVYHRIDTRDSPYTAGF